MKMFRELLHLHWKAVRWPLAPFVLLAFGLPMYVMRMMQVPRGFSSSGELLPAEILSWQQGWLPVFPLLAVVIGVTVALTAWSWDHQSRHVYALSLPVSRRRYALLKMAAGVVLAAVPILALFIGTVLGVALTDLPSELHAYPFSFTLRFMLAVLVVYAATFALASTTVRTTVIVMGGIIGFLVFGSILVSFLQEALHRPDLPTPFYLAYQALMRWPGPFSVFSGSWMIVDA